MQPQLVAEQRRTQATLAELLNRHIRSQHHLIDTAALDATLPRWVTVSTALVQQYAKASASVAGAFYLAERHAAGVPGRFTVAYATPPAADQVTASLGFAASKLYGQPDPRVFDTVLAGVAQRLMVDAGRRTVLQSVQRDRQARGWVRETAGGCDFCQMLAGRGAVYRSETTADFEAHDHCQCLAVPEF